MGAFLKNFEQKCNSQHTTLKIKSVYFISKSKLFDSEQH